MSQHLISLSCYVMKYVTKSKPLFKVSDIPTDTPCRFPKEGRSGLKWFSKPSKTSSSSHHIPELNT